ncbi:MAG: LytTR family DNA-binding domain-containing protein [Clostridium sp.]|nr:LytTR family DNA-binding domain-containing protein [Clostridium sp.]
MKILVIDDERPARKELIHQILDLYPDSLIQEADSGLAALECISSQAFDLLFVDINLNDMEGTTLAGAAKKILPNAQIVFATAYSQYAVRAFELGVNNYILKPFDPERLWRVLEKCHRDYLALREAENTELQEEAGEQIKSGRESQEEASPEGFASNRLAINVNRTFILLDIDQIVYIETSGRSCIIHTTSKDYTENQLLGEYEKRLASKGFCRIHKSYLVNLNYIAEMFPWANNSLALKMQGFEKNILPVGRERVKHLRHLLGI